MSDSKSPQLLVGIDGGGTATRCVIAKKEGNSLIEVARAVGSGINPHSGADPGQVLSAVVGEALQQLGPQKQNVVGGVAGLAGAESGFTEMNNILQSIWGQQGLRGEVKLCSDPVIAFWSGQEESINLSTGGIVLIAGTGAIAATVEGLRVTSRIDGYGYLLGDRGAGLWLGRKAVQAALDGETGRGAETRLTRAIVGERTVEEVLAECYRQSPAELGKYAPLVTELAQQGDPVARIICQKAACELWATLSVLLTARNEESVVLVGSVATGQNVVALELKKKLTEAGITYHQGSTGIRGALNLAKKLYLEK